MTIELNQLQIKGHAFIAPVIKPKAEKAPKRAKADVIPTEIGNFISIQKATEILDGISNSVVYTAAKKENIRSIMVDGYQYFSEDDVTEWQNYRVLRNEVAPRKPRSKKSDAQPVVQAEQTEQAEVMQ